MAKLWMPKFERYQTVWCGQYECQVVYVDAHVVPTVYVLQFPDKSVGAFRENEIDARKPTKE